MNVYTVTISASKGAIDELEQQLCVYNPKEFPKRNPWERIDAESIEFNPPFVDIPDSAIADISKKHPGEIKLHYFASLGCAYHTIDMVFSNGIKTVTLDEHDLIC